MFTLFFVLKAWRDRLLCTAVCWTHLAGSLAPVRHPRSAPNHPPLPSHPSDFSPPPPLPARAGQKKHDARTRRCYPRSSDCYPSCARAPPHECIGWHGCQLGQPGRCPTLSRRPDTPRHPARETSLSVFAACPSFSAFRGFSGQRWLPARFGGKRCA